MDTPAPLNLSPTIFIDQLPPTPHHCLQFGLVAWALLTKGYTLEGRPTHKPELLVKGYGGTLAHVTYGDVLVGAMGRINSFGGGISPSVFGGQLVADVSTVLDTAAWQDLVTSQILDGRTMGGLQTMLESFAKKASEHENDTNLGADQRKAFTDIAYGARAILTSLAKLEAGQGTDNMSRPPTDSTGD